MTCPKGRDCDFFDENLNGCDREDKVCEHLDDEPVINEDEE